MKFNNSYSNVFVVEEIGDVITHIDNLVDNTISNTEVSYVEFGIEQLQDMLISNYLMSEFLRTNKQEVLKHQYVLLIIDIYDRRLSVSIGRLSNDDKTEYICGLITD